MNELYRPQLRRELLEFVRKPIIQNLLYDADLLPEQLKAQKEMTLGLFAAYYRLEGVLLAFKYLELQGIKVEPKTENSQVVLVTDGPEIKVVDNKDDVEVYIVESQMTQEDETYAKDLWKSFPAMFRHYVEDYMEPEWIEDLKQEEADNGQFGVGA